MASANPKGRTPTKRIDMFKDHEFVVGKLVLGRDESAETYQVIFGAGTYSAPIECTTDEDMHWIDLNLKGNAPAGSNRAIFINLHQAVTGTATPVGIKAYTVIDDGIAVTGAGVFDGRISFGTVGAKVTGECAVVTGQLAIPNRAMDAGGGYYCGKFEIYLSGASSVVTPITPDVNMALLKLQVFGGDAADRQLIHNVFQLTGEAGNKAAKLMVANADVTGSGGASAYGFQVRVNGTQYWIPLYTI